MRELIFLVGGPLMNAAVSLFIVLPLASLVRGDARRFVEFGALPYAALFYIVVALLPATASFATDGWFAKSSLGRRVLACGLAGLAGGLVFPAALLWLGIVQDRSMLVFVVLDTAMGAACCWLAARYERR